MDEFTYFMGIYMVNVLYLLISAATLVLQLVKCAKTENLRISITCIECQWELHSIAYLCYMYSIFRRLTQSITTCTACFKVNFFFLSGTHISAQKVHRWMLHKTGGEYRSVAYSNTIFCTVMIVISAYIWCWCLCLWWWLQLAMIPLSASALAQVVSSATKLLVAVGAPELVTMPSPSRWGICN